MTLPLTQKLNDCFVKGELIDYFYIEDNSYIPDIVNLIKNSTNPIALDLETYPDFDKCSKLEGLIDINRAALDAHLALVRLVQINFLGSKYPIVIDVKKIGKEKVLPIIEAIEEIHYSIDVIAHNASFEYMMILSNWNIKLLNIKDSLIAAYTNNVSTGWKAGKIRGSSLKDLARDYFRIDLSKQEQLSDWSRDELSNAQKEYSALDVGVPKGYNNPFTQKPMTSIVIELYELMAYIANDFHTQYEAFLLDQELVPLMADAMYKGMPVNKKLLKEMNIHFSKLKEKATISICKELGLKLSRSVILEDGRPISKLVIPDYISKKLNDSKGLLQIVNSVLKSESLEDLKSASLETELKKYEDLDSEEEEAFYKINSKILNLILEYRKHKKLLEDGLKYYKSINPITERIHAKINVIGTSTSRMSSGGEGESEKNNIQAISARSVTMTLKEGTYFDID